MENVEVRKNEEGYELNLNTLIYSELLMSNVRFLVTNQICRVQIQFVTFLILPNLNIPHLGYRLRIGNVPLSHLVVFPSSSVLATFNQNEESD